jgi:FixJ family two-component response regulator
MAFIMRKGNVVELPPRFIVALIDSDPACRDRIAETLSCNGYDVHAYAGGDGFIDGHDALAVGCILLDLKIGPDFLGHARRQGHDAPVVVMSDESDIPPVVRAIQSGAQAWIGKPVDCHQLLSVVKQACHLHRSYRQRFVPAKDAIEKYRRLTPRESDVFWLLTKGMSSKEIALQLGISVRTVETHRGHVYDKFGATSLKTLIDLTVPLAPILA